MCLQCLCDENTFNCLYHIFTNRQYFKIPLTPMGVLAPGSAHARPFAQPPIDMSGNFPAHVSAESLF